MHHHQSDIPRRRVTDNLGIRKFFENNWEMMTLWTILIGLFYLLRPFFLMIFETFLLTYIMRHAAEWVVRKLRCNYALATTLLFVLAVSLIAAIGTWVGPKLLIESNEVLMEFAGDGSAQTVANVHHTIDALVTEIAGADQAPIVLSSQEYLMVMNTVRIETEKAVLSVIPHIPKILLHIVKFCWEIALSLFLALIFSFILVLDWRKIALHMRALEKSRIRIFYIGAAPHLRAFADVLGKTFRAQAIIATCNTILTALGLWYFDVPNIALLSAIVFFCGFIPILGTFISSTPILLFGIQSGGLGLGIKLVVLIGLVHAFEAYLLNPRITGNILHAHPILILALLLIGERFFGLWGMFVGVPIGFYIISVLTKKDATLPVDDSEEPASHAHGS